MNALVVSLVAFVSASRPALATSTRTLVYVTDDSPEPSVVVLDAASEYVSRIALPEYGGASAIAVSADGSVACVLQHEQTVIVDATRGAIAGIVPVTGSDVALAPDGGVAYVAGCSLSGLCVIDMTTMRVATVIPVLGSHLALDPAGGTVYVSGDELTVVDAHTNRIIRQAAVRGGRVAVSHDGQRVYVGTPGFVIVVDGTLNLIATIPIGTGVRDIALTPDDRLLYLATDRRVPYYDDLSSVVLVLDPSSGEVVSEVLIGDTPAPLRVAVTPDGARAYVVLSDGNVSIVDTTTRQVGDVFGIGEAPTDIAIRSVTLVPTPTPWMEDCGSVCTGQPCRTEGGGGGNCLDTGRTGCQCVLEVTPTATPVLTPVSACAGDCGEDGTVTINELIRAVNIALGRVPVADCRAVDRDGNGGVSIGELITGVNAALGGCA